MTPTPAARPPLVARHAEKRELRKLADVLSRSFWDDPVMSWIIPNERLRYARLLLFFHADLHMIGRRGTVLTTDDLGGAALWLPPGRRNSKKDRLREAPSLIRAVGRRIPASFTLLGRMEQAHPIEPHWYLSVIGTDPIRQGRGIGGALIRQVTDRCDREGTGAYLESSKAVNVPYYERFGFVVTKEIPVPDGPALWGMWRDPRPPDE